MIDQNIINIIALAFGSLFGFLLRSITTTIRELQEQDKILIDRIAHIEVLVAGQYVRRDEWQKSVERIFNKLDHIEESLTGKIDRNTSGGR